MSGPGKTGEGKGMMYLAFALGGAVVFFIIGLVFGKMNTPTARR